MSLALALALKTKTRLVLPVMNEITSQIRCVVKITPVCVLNFVPSEGTVM